MNNFKKGKATKIRGKRKFFSFWQKNQNLVFLFSEFRNLSPLSHDDVITKSRYVSKWSLTISWTISLSELKKIEENKKKELSQKKRGKNIYKKVLCSSFSNKEILLFLFPFSINFKKNPFKLFSGLIPLWHWIKKWVMELFFFFLPPLLSLIHNIVKYGKKWFLIPS